MCGKTVERRKSMQKGGLGAAVEAAISPRHRRGISVSPPRRRRRERQRGLGGAKFLKQKGE